MRTSSQKYLFTTDFLLGPDSLRKSDREIVKSFFVDVIRRRNMPLHVSNLWNALYFYYDLEYGGYHQGSIHLDRIPERVMNDRATPLPVGGFVRVKTSAGPLLAEVIYKEGRHSDLTSERCPPELSRAAQPPTSSEGRCLREALVLDYAAFGTDGAISEAALSELRHRGKWLDRNGHVVLEANYREGDEHIDDLTFYARYIFNQHREGLGNIRNALTSEANDDDLWLTFLNSLHAVRELASQVPELGSWGNYYFDAVQYEATIGNRARDAVFGENDLKTIFTSLQRNPTHEPVVYSPMGPKIEGFLSQDGLSSEEQTFLAGPRYAASVCFANSYVRDRIEKDSVDGLIAGRCHIRLDDQWQGGGIWRSDTSSGIEHSALRQVPPMLTLGLGFNSSNKAIARSDAVDAIPQSVMVESSELNWRVSLCARDLDFGRLQVPEKIVETIGASEKLFLEIDGIGLTDRHPVRLKARCLEDVIWPIEFYPGITLFCSAPRTGSVVRARPRELYPRVNNGGVLLKWEFNGGLYEGKQMRKPALEKATSLNDLIHRVFRERGRRLPDGSWELEAREILGAILGPRRTPEECRPILAALQAMDLDIVDGAHIWRPRVTRKTSLLDRTLLDTYGKASKERIARLVRPHEVMFHLRRDRPSAQKIAEYAAALQRFGLVGRYQHQLPEGYTWVKPHVRQREGSARD